jgi:uncharacterized membrane protein
MVETLETSAQPLGGLEIRKVDGQQPWQWLKAGFDDMMKTPMASLLYGAIFVLMGYGLEWMVGQAAHMVLALAAGFMLVGPFVAIGLYDLSRRTGAGEPATLAHALGAWRENPAAIGLFGVLLGLVTVLWVRLAALVFAVILVQSGSAIEVGGSVREIFFSESGLTFLVTFMLVGAPIALLVFCISVVSVPLMMDRGTPLLQAVAVSLAAVRLNPVPMAIWAAIIAMLTFIGLAVFYVLLAFTLPLVGHATWHAYKDLVA